MADKEFTFNARLERRTTVVVWAESATEALAKFKAGQFEEDSFSGELVNWEATSRPVQSDD